MTRLRGLLLAGALLFPAAFTPASAQTQVKLTGAGNTVAFGVYVGPYKGQLGSGPGAATVDLFCVDYLNHSQVGQTWMANKSFIGSNVNLNAARYGASANALEKYRMAAWLTTQFATAPPTQWGDIHATIWHLMTPSSPNYTPNSLWLAAAQNFYLTNTDVHFYDRFAILSDVNMTAPNQLGVRTGGVQEFIVVTPEPGTMLLLGTGLVGLVVVGYRRLA